MPTPTDPSARVADDAGFTLPELLVAITIMILVVGTLGFVLVGSMRTLASSQERVERSKDAALVGFQFPTDISGATAVSVAAAPPCTPTATTSDPHPPTAALLQITTNNVASGSNKKVWYGKSSTGALMRYECGASGVARRLSLVTSVAGTPSVTCEKQLASPTPSASSYLYFGAVADCSGTVARVRLDLTINPVTSAGAGTVDAARTVALFGVMPR